LSFIKSEVVKSFTEVPQEQHTSAMNGVSGIYASLANSAWFSYLTIVLLQLKVIWDVWRVRDLTSGDTSYYFLTAYDWFKNGSTLITWSPLYTTFYASFLHLSSDAEFVTLAHRLIIVLVLAVLVLAVMRKFLPGPIAWFMAAWWVILPIDFDALYEVHLFGLIPILITILIAAGGTRLQRGCGLAGLLATGLLMRNETLVAAAAFAIFIALYEFRVHRSSGREFQAMPLLRSYGLPVLVVLLITGFFYSRATDAPVIGAMLARKHSLNVCQTYAFGYQQRHSDWTQSPWTACQSLMTIQFGSPEPSLLQAFVANPAAMIEHFAWNLRLIPNGLQTLLFNRMSGQVNPDYIPPTGGSVLAAFLSVILLLILILGARRLAGQERHLLKLELAQRAWGWLMLACFSALTLMIVIMQRPRPSYMFALGIAIRVVAGLCLFSFWPRARALTNMNRYFPVAAVLAILFVPAYYATLPPPSANSLSTLYTRLRPFEPLFEAGDVKFSAVGWVPELCNYLAKTNRTCNTEPYLEFRKGAGGSMTLGKLLNQKNINLFYADETIFADPMGRQFMSDPAADGWEQIGFEDLPGRRWMLFKKSFTRKESVSLLAEIVHKGQGLSLGSGWYDFETFHGGSFRWVKNDAEIQAGSHEDRFKFLILDVEPGPGMAVPLHFHVVSDGKELTKVDVSGRQTIKVPMGTTETPRVIRLHVDGEGKPTPTDQRILNFRVFNIELASE
jgi:hypothetical protein